MAKKLLALFVSLLLALYLMPLGTLAQNALSFRGTTLIYEVYVEGADLPPVPGEFSEDHLEVSVPNGAPYYVIEAFWFDNTPYYCDMFWGDFEEDVYYNLVIGLCAQNGYDFDDSCSLYVNGSSLLVDEYRSWVDSGSGYVYIWTKPMNTAGEFISEDRIPITEVYIKGYDYPVAYEDPYDHLELSVPDGAPYEIWNCDWANESIFFEGDEGFDYFEEGESYSMYCFLIPEDGYFFAPDCVFYVNGDSDLAWEGYSGVEVPYGLYAYIWTVPALSAPGVPPEPDPYCITEAYIDGVEMPPISGAYSEYHLHLSVPEGEPYSVSFCIWWDSTPSVDNSFTGYFEDGVYYSVYIELMADPGYYFSDSCAFYINGDESNTDYTNMWVDDNYACVWSQPMNTAGDLLYENLIPINEAYLYGYESPVAGEYPADHSSITVPEGAHYSVYPDDWALEWWDEDNFDFVYGAFEEGVFYTLGITLVADAGYYFESDCDYYINGTQSLVNYYNCGIIDDHGFLAWVSTVPEPASAPATDIWGDADCDGDVDSADTLIVMRAAMGLSPLPSASAEFCDVNGDGAVDMSDALLIARYTMGLIDSLPI